MYRFFSIFFAVTLLLGNTSLAQAQTSPDLPPLPQDSPSTGTLSCFDYYTFGSIQADLQPNLAQSVPGASLTFAGTIINSNPYPLLDGTLYVKIFRRDEATFSAGDGNPVVDQFVVKKDITLPANGSIPASYTWNIPQNAEGGEYYAAYFFTTSKRYNLMGLSFTDDVVGNQAPFMITSDVKDNVVTLQKTTTTLNGEDHRFAAFPLHFDRNDAVTVKTTLKNPTNEPKTIPLQWNQYAWDSQNDDNRRSTKTELITLKANETKEVSYEVKGQRESVVYLSVIAQDGETKSILNIRYVKDNVEETRINFPSVTAFPLKKDTPNTLFACAHSTNLPVVPGNTLTLTLTDRDNQTIHQYKYEGDISGAMAGFGDTFTPSKNINYATLTATLQRNGVTVEEVSLTYDCNTIDAASCLPEEKPIGSLFDTLKTHTMTILLTIVTLLLLTALISFFVKKRRGHIVASFVFLLLAGPLFFAPVQTEAKSVSWTGGASPTLVSYKYVTDFCYQNCSDPDPDQWDLTQKWVPLGTFDSSNVTIQRISTVRNNTTATALTDGDTIPVGTSISFQPKADENTDITWNGTGYSSDTPYGFWGTTAPAPCSGVPTDFDGPFIGGATFDIYSSFGAAPVTPGIAHSGSAGLSCDGSGLNCTVTSPGTINTTITWPSTTGNFFFSEYKRGFVTPAAMNYFRGNRCHQGTVLKEHSAGVFNAASPDPHTVFSTNPAYVVSAPAQVITHSLNAVAAANTPPNPPTITGPVTGAENTLYGFAFNATDPDNDTLRYEVDWDNNGFGDATFPSTGYSPSGTTENGTKLWPTAGSYTFQARTQDSAGNVSTTWTSHTIVIDPPATSGCMLPPGNAAGDAAIANCAAYYGASPSGFAVDLGGGVLNVCRGFGPAYPEVCDAQGGTFISDPFCTAVPACTLPPSASLTINGSAGPLTVNVNDPLVITWTSSSAPSCTKFGAGWGSGEVVATADTNNILATVSDTYLINCGGVIDTVDVTVTNRPPSNPTIVGPVTGDPGTPYSFDLQSIDPDNDTLYYEVDWNNNGVIDGGDATTLVVASGNIQTATNPWATAGSYTFQARAIDSKGGISGWTPHTIVINPPAPPTVTTEAQVNSGAFSTADQTVNPGDTVTLKWDSTGATSCTGTGAGYSVAGTSGTDPVTTPAPNTSTTFDTSCTGPGGTSNDSIVITTRQLPNFNQPSISATPSAGFNPVTGEYDFITIEFTTTNNGGSDTTTSANYEFQFDRGANGYEVTTTGSLGLLNVSQTVNRTEVVTGNIPFTNNRIRVFVDSNTDVAETDESDNVRVLETNVVFGPPNPNLEINADRRLVRNGETVTLTWDTKVTYPMNCSVFGPGVGPINFDPSVSGRTGTQVSAPLNAKSEYTLRCIEPLTNTTFSDSVIVETQGVIEEV